MLRCPYTKVKEDRLISGLLPQGNFERPSTILTLEQMLGFYILVGSRMYKSSPKIQVTETETERVLRWFPFEDISGEERFGFVGSFPLSAGWDEKDANDFWTYISEVDNISLPQGYFNETV